MELERLLAIDGSAAWDVITSPGTARATPGDVIRAASRYAGRYPTVGRCRPKVIRDAAIREALETLGPVDAAAIALALAPRDAWYVMSGLDHRVRVAIEEAGGPTFPVPPSCND